MGYKNIFIALSTFSITLIGFLVVSNNTPKSQPVQAPMVKVSNTPVPTRIMPTLEPIQQNTVQVSTKTNKITCQIMGDTYSFTTEECAYWQAYWQEKYAQSLENINYPSSEDSHVDMPEYKPLIRQEFKPLDIEPMPTAPTPDYSEALKPIEHSPIKTCKWVQNNIKGYVEEVCE
jgi:hypothetical protein